ncbi:GGDEF family protein [Fulvimarina pelagi HTCC2506]|uniref:GGDEF family protein n=1 Tax=Fulvimarina pelagi HTCC2506 TaxID=314231 RepID=Q0G5H0_9HYPH|nr:EAL domain-containing protein [Fulvimarina pelagi]EAU43094.1 GGDEF family protein [Fulvimarina pelagi HTCC2506]
MPVISCILTEHDLLLVLLAAVMCAIGSFATTRLWRNAVAARQRDRFHWCFLTGVTGGSSIWATHFIAMLGYQTPVPATFDPKLTVISIVIAILGTSLGIALTTSSNRLIARLVGGATLGLSIAAMHFVGMFAYRVDGIVSWDQTYIVLSIVASIGFSVLATFYMTGGRAPAFLSRTNAAVISLILAIVLLHFTAMDAFSVAPIAGLSSGADSGAFSAMAMSVALVALLIVFTGFSSEVIEFRNKTRSEIDLNYIATHDELTGVPNRRKFSEILADRCAKTRDTGAEFSLIMIDLDRFKPVNDTLGHTTGDAVLKRVANRLEHVIRASDFLARLGGDEFAIIALGSTGDRSNVLRLCDRIIDVLSRPFIINGHVIELGASLGVAIAPAHGTTADDLTQSADIALYAAKDAGRSTYKLFETAMADEVQLRRSLEIDLRRALNREEFEVYYQPQVDAKSGDYSGAEALIRWRHPQRGMLSPVVFIPLAEELGLIGPIGNWVLRQACRDAVTWPSHLSVAVNLSPAQMMDRRLPKSVKSILNETGLDPARLELEITETSLIGNDVQALAVLNELRAMGIAISLDDFGTGYSSLSYLHRFPINRIKIDRSFIDRIPTDVDSAAIVQAIAKLGGSLGMKITAEGIENEEQWSFSKTEGCDHLQGYLFSKPIPGSEIGALFDTKDSAERAA